MADGDAAAAAGLAVVAGTADVREAFKEINKSRDYTANHQTAGTHPASAITSGVLATARIPDLDAAKITTGVLAAARVKELSGGGVSFYPQYSTQYTCSNSLGVLGALAVNGAVSFADALNGIGSWNSLAIQTGTGRLGIPVSSKRFKENIKPTPREPLAKIGLAVVCEFDYKEDFGGGHETGLIAEDLADLGLEFLVRRDAEGVVEGIHYDKVAVALLGYVQTLETRIAKLEGQK